MKFLPWLLGDSLPSRDDDAAIMQVISTLTEWAGEPLRRDWRALISAARKREKLTRSDQLTRRLREPSAWATKKIIVPIGGAIIVAIVAPLVTSLVTSQRANPGPAALVSKPHPTARTTAMATRTTAANPSDPASVVVAYYSAINARNYQRAWQLGGSHSGSGSYAQFAAGFADTSSDEILIKSVRGDVVTADLKAYQAGGNGHYLSFAGAYTVRNGQIVAFAIQPAA